MKRILFFHNDNPLSPLAEGCLTLTPQVFLPNPQLLYLDIEPTLKYFGGEKTVLELANHLVQDFHPTLPYVLTDRVEWAWALATKPQVLVPPQQSLSLLSELPIERILFCGDPLRFEKEKKEKEKLILFMKRVGIHRIRDFATLPTSSILRRFGKLGLSLQDWATGKKECLLPLFSPPETLEETLDIEEIISIDDLVFQINDVCTRLERRLRGRSEAVLALTFHFLFSSTSKQKQILRFSEPLQEATQIIRLVREFLYSLHWESPPQRLRVEVSDKVTHTPLQLSLWDKSEERFTDLGYFVSRLRSRFGNAAVGFTEYREDYFPEASFHLQWPPPKPSSFFFPKRPPFLFHPPKPLLKLPTHWRLTSTERITQWWRGKHRHYFIAETYGEKLWIYQDELTKLWFIQGTFD